MENLKIGFNFRDVEYVGNDKKHEFYTLNSVITKWIEKLGLSDQPFRIVFDDPNNPQMKGDGSVAWNGKEWEVQCKYMHKYIIIHEIGHVYLHKILNQFEFVKEDASRVTFRTHIETKIIGLISCFEDFLVDYNLSRFPEFYNIIANYFINFERIPNIISMAHGINDPLHLYINTFLNFRSILRDKERSQIEGVCKLHLKELRKIIIEKYKKQNKKLTFDKFDAKLLEFDEIKDLSELIGERSEAKILDKNNEIVRYYYDVIKSLGLYNANVIKKALRIKLGVKLN